MHPETYIAGALMIALTACSAPPEESADLGITEIISGDFEARATSAGLELTNHSVDPVYYRARDPLSLALSGRVPCQGPEGCPRVAAHSRLTVPFNDAIVGYRSDTRQAEVYWWHFVQQPDGSVAADEVRTLEVVFEARKPPF
jgi:hypothetical protein